MKERWYADGEYVRCNGHVVCRCPNNPVNAEGWEQRRDKIIIDHNMADRTVTPKLQALADAVGGYVRPSNEHHTGKSWLDVLDALRAYESSQAAPEESIAPETLHESEDVKPEEDLSEQVKENLVWISVLERRVKMLEPLERRVAALEGRDAWEDKVMAVQDSLEQRVAETNALALRVQQANDAAARTLLDMKRRVGGLEADVSILGAGDGSLSRRVAAMERRTKNHGLALALHLETTKPDTPDPLQAAKDAVCKASDIYEAFAYKPISDTRLTTDEWNAMSGQLYEEWLATVRRLRALKGSQPSTEDRGGP